jgi:hypothetical protein
MRTPTGPTPRLAGRLHTADVTNSPETAHAPTTGVCPTCSELVEQPRTGRRRIYCSAACRRDMYDMVAELAALEADLAERESLARNAHNHHWRGVHERHAAGLRAAVAEARMRIPERSTT